MAISRFNPGFRLSSFDIVILVAGLVGTVLIGAQVWWAGLAIGLVVLHFFLFCNVFRISRPPELIWAATFIALAGSTILIEFPGWIATLALSITLSSYLIWRETMRDDYHGICWKTWNPKLPDWWKTHRAGNGGEQDSADQPAITPESKPEGKGKPQPESEERSR